MLASQLFIVGFDSLLEKMRNKKEKESPMKIKLDGPPLFTFCHNETICHADFSLANT